MEKVGLRVEGKGIRVRMLVEDGSFCETEGFGSLTGKKIEFI